MLIPLLKYSPQEHLQGAGVAYSFEICTLLYAYFKNASACLCDCYITWFVLVHESLQYVVYTARGIVVFLHRADICVPGEGNQRRVDSQRI